MKKKLILLLVLALFVVGGIFSQEKDNSQETEDSQETGSSQSGKHSVMIDTVPLFSGIIAGDSDMGLSCFGLAFVYEYNVKPHFSIGARFGFYTGDMDNINYSFVMLSAHGRWYPFSEGTEELFIDAGLGIYSFNIDETGFDRHTDLTFDLAIGYKLMFNDMFYLEPSLGYMLSDAEMLTSEGGMEGMAEGLGLYKWHIGMGIGLRF